MRVGVVDWAECDVAPQLWVEDQVPIHAGQGLGQPPPPHPHADAGAGGWVGMISRKGAIA